MTVLSYPHQVTRLAFGTSQPYEQLRARYEDAVPVLDTQRLAGDTGPCTAYLMGNHVLAEQMYRHDPAVMLYATLRTAIYVDARDHTKFVIDRPGSVFSSFGSAAIAGVGFELEAKLADLLQALDIPPGGELA